MINAAFVGGLSVPNQMALFGRHLFVTDGGNSTIGEYDATTGAAINPSLIPGLNQPFGIAIGRLRQGDD